MAVRRESGGYDGGMKNSDNSMVLQSSEESEDEEERRKGRAPSVDSLPSVRVRAPARSQDGPGQDGEPRFSFGQYNGEKFSVITEEEPSYYFWAFSQKRPGITLQRYIAWVDEYYENRSRVLVLRSDPSRRSERTPTPTKPMGDEDAGEIETPGCQGEWGLGVCGPLRALVQRRRLLTAGKLGEVRGQDLC